MAVLPLPGARPTGHIATGDLDRVAPDALPPNPAAGAPIPQTAPDTAPNTGSGAEPDATPPAPARLRAPRRFLAALGRFARVRIGFVLMLAATGWGVFAEGIRPTSWRRTVRAEFATTLRQAAGGGLPSTLFTAVLAGIGMVSQAVYWLGVAGLSELTASLLVTVLLREVAPVLVGVILLGRTGMLAVAELGLLQSGGQVRTLIAEGIDPFALLVMPRVAALAVAGFTLGIAFCLFALIAGYVFSASLGSAFGSLWSFLAYVLGAIGARDFILIPTKFVLIGFAVGLCACLSGLVAEEDEDIASLLPRGFARGMLAVMGVDIAFTVLDA